MTSSFSPLRRAMALAAVAAFALPHAAVAQTLDGQSFQGVFIAKGKTHGDADTVTFKNGRFRSSACDRYGYSDAEYRLTSEGGVLRFEAETESAKYGKLRWTGYVRGDKLDATAVSLQDGKAPVENWVVASLRK